MAFLLFGEYGYNTQIDIVWSIKEAGKWYVQDSLMTITIF
jgi:sulfite reductase alpha subunit-like flavoprotein